MLYFTTNQKNKRYFVFSVAGIAARTSGADSRRSYFGQSDVSISAISASQPREQGGAV